MRKLMLVVTFVSAVSLAQAAGIPTVDVSNIVQTTTSAMENIQQTMKQIEQFKTQLQQFEDQLKNSMMPEDMLNGMFQDLLGSLKDITSQGSSGSSAFGQFGGFTYSPNSDGNYFQSSSGNSSMGGYIETVYRDHNYYYNEAKQNDERAYTTAGSAAVNLTVDEWLLGLEKQQELLNKQVNEGMDELMAQNKDVANDDAGGTNKLLAYQNNLLLTLIRETMTMRQMMITRELAEATVAKNANARLQDQEAQAKKLLGEDQFFKAQTGGNYKPLEFKGSTSGM